MKFFNVKPFSLDVGLLIIRGSVALFMAYVHGLAKLTSFPQKSEHFYNFLGMGPAMSLTLVIFAEFLCSILLGLGLLTRLSLIPLIFTMFVAAFVAQAGATIAEKETALIYLLIYIGLFLTGPGKYSLDDSISKN